jgi:glycosyltransferase involved in cell wall biosynthesis
MANNFSDEVECTFSIKISQNEYIKELSDVNIYHFLDNFNFRGKACLMETLNRIFSIQKILEGNYDIYHQTHYNPYAYSYLPKEKKKVVTMFDMNYYVIPNFYKDCSYLKVFEWQKISASKADKIIAISANTKNDLVNIWNIPPEKVEVIHLGVDDIPEKTLNQNRKIECPYILFVGRREEYKNFKNCLEAFKIAREKIYDLQLVCTGFPFTREERNMIEDLNLSNNVVQIFVDENTLLNLFNNAEIFVFPSLYEGFGLPLLEAMACHCPVICSNASCFPEIAGDAALYFDPYSIEDMAESIIKVLKDIALRKRMIAKGLERKNYFSWKKCAEKHVALYKSLL